MLSYSQQWTKPDFKRRWIVTGLHGNLAHDCPYISANGIRPERAMLSWCGIACAETFHQSPIQAIHVICWLCMTNSVDFKSFSHFINKSA
jgi:hypothetical protein